jgi:hypothetical protein
MPTSHKDRNPEVALESDVPEFTRAIVNRRLAAMGSSVRIGGDVELSRETLDYAAGGLATEPWGPESGGGSASGAGYPPVAKKASTWKMPNKSPIG